MRNSHKKHDIQAEIIRDVQFQRMMSHNHHPQNSLKLLPQILPKNH